MGTIALKTQIRGFKFMFIKYRQCNIYFFLYHIFVHISKVSFLQVGDMISVIDMPGPEESIWWRGKRGFEVGFFPCDCVEVIGDKVRECFLKREMSNKS